MNTEQIEALLLTPIRSNVSDVIGESKVVKNDCWNCIHRKPVPGNSHIECVKPDTEMTGNLHGIRNGWFMYPLLFDPAWMTKKCSNYEPVNLAVESIGKSE